MLRKLIETQRDFIPSPGDDLIGAEDIRAGLRLLLNNTIEPSSTVPDEENESAQMTLEEGRMGTCAEDQLNEVA